MNEEKQHNFKQKKVVNLSAGFSLIELLIVIAIIGILAGVVMVNAGSGVEKAKKASALSSLASVMPELVACQDDGGKASPRATGAVICCPTTAACSANSVAGHSVTWPDITTKPIWVWTAGAGATIDNNFTYSATKGTNTITCNYGTGDCN
ncbi:MAG: type II secretion system protein [Candidatus Moraniibacteriota bacterium]